MDNRSKNPAKRKCLLHLVTVIVLLGAFAVFFWKVRPLLLSASSTGQPQESGAPAEETAKPEKEKPAERAKVVLRSRLAGSWYTADPETLSKQIAGFFQKADVRPIDNVIALILPHAGYRFSGHTAVMAIKKTEKKYKRVVAIGPSHNPYLSMQEVLSLPRVTHYETPLGQVPLDVEFIDKLLNYPMFQNIARAHRYERGRQEHSVQIELPLLQYGAKDFKFVPIVAGTCSLETITKAARILRSLVDKETLVIASSDFVHYGPRYGYLPFTKNVPEQIKKLDMGAYEYIAASDTKGFLEYKRTTGATICGYIPVAILLSMLERPAEAKLIKYTTSGELTGDFSNSVSYLSVAFSGKWRSRSHIGPKSHSTELTQEDKRRLLALARQTILYALRKRQVPQVTDFNVTISDAMRHPRAAFVTLKKNSHLRGCIGDIFPQRPLYKSVILNAINASVNDRRFVPVTTAECNDITIQISALTAPKPIASPAEIRIGIDGVVLNKAGRSAVFLPQVAPEQGWDLNQMLTNLSLKAKLPEDAWKEGANFLVFQADVFGEEK